MVRIRLRRMGSKKQPQYRIVVANREAARDGAFIEIIGLFNPRTEPETVQIQEERALHWMKVGALPSDAVARLLKNAGTVDRFERLKKGEAVEALVAEAKTQVATTPVPSPKTRIGRKAAAKAPKAASAEAAA